MTDMLLGRGVPVIGVFAGFGRADQRGPARLALMSADDKQAEFRAFYQSEYSPLAGYVWNLVRDLDLAHDIAQESFTRLFSRWITVREPKPYLFIVATNLAKASWRRSGLHRQALQSLSADQDHTSPAADAGLPVRDAVAQLPDKLRDVVLLYYYADLSVPDVARAVGRPAGTVKRLLSEARAALAASLSDPEAETSDD